MIRALPVESKLGSVLHPLASTPGQERRAGIAAAAYALRVGGGRQLAAELVDALGLNHRPMRSIRKIKESPRRNRSRT